jgi:hypothetical protein
MNKNNQNKNPQNKPNTNKYTPVKVNTNKLNPVKREEIKAVLNNKNLPSASSINKITKTSVFKTKKKKSVT